MAIGPGGAPFYMSTSQFEYWQHRPLIIDAISGRGGMFSFGIGTEQRFPARS